MPRPRLLSETIARARSVSIDQIIADRQIKLKASGAERIGPCPVCGGRDRFSINTKKNVFNCRGCSRGGDVITLIQFLDGIGFQEAVESLTGERQSSTSKNIEGARELDRASLASLEHAGHLRHGVDPANEQKPNAERKIVATYDYTDSDGALIYQVVRFKPKDFKQRRPDGSGDWVWSLDNLNGRRILYRWPDLTKYPDATVFVCEGEKDADRVASLDQCATTIAGDGHWTADCIEPLKGRNVFILEDNDDTGRKKALKAAMALNGSAASIRVVKLPDLPEGKDVGDWLDADPVRAEALVDICIKTPEWTPAADEARADGPKHDQSRSRLEVVCMSDVRPTAIEWLWQNWIAIGKVHILAGDGGLGKSTILCGLTATTTTGTEWPDGARADQAGSVIILAAEDAVEDTLAPRLMAAGADLSRVFVIRSVLDENRRRSFNLQADLERLEAEIQKRDNVRLVIIDPVSSYLGKVDSHKNADVRSVLEPLGELAARLGVAVICNNHFSKGGGSANNRVIGSVAFVNQARAAFIVTPDEKDQTRRLLIPSKMNIAPMGYGLAYRIEGCLIEHDRREIATSRIMYESTPVTVTADQALAALDGNRESKSEKSEAIEYLMDMLGEGPVSAKDIKRDATDAGISPKSLRGAREALGVKPERIGFGSEGGWVWSLPKMPKDAKGAHVSNGASLGEKGTFGGIRIGSSGSWPMAGQSR
jgi:putative DNA primase/helicase